MCLTDNLAHLQEVRTNQRLRGIPSLGRPPRHDCQTCRNPVFRLDIVYLHHLYLILVSPYRFYYRVPSLSFSPSSQVPRARHVQGHKIRSHE